MKNYLLTVIWVAIIVAVVELLSPNLEGIKRHLRLIGGLCVVCAVMLPLINIGASSENFLFDIKENILNDIDKEAAEQEYRDKLNNYLYNYSETQFKEEIYMHLSNEFDVSKEEANIKIFLKDTTTKALEKIQIILSGKSIFKNPYNIEEYFEKLINCKCEVLIK